MMLTVACLEVALECAADYSAEPATPLRAARDFIVKDAFFASEVAYCITPGGQRERKEIEQLAIAREMVDLEPDEQVEVWHVRTSASRATLYRRIAKLGQMDAQSFET